MFVTADEDVEQCDACKASEVCEECGERFEVVGVEARCLDCE